jgi:hypothetical protein
LQDKLTKQGLQALSWGYRCCDNVNYRNVVRLILLVHTWKIIVRNTSIGLHKNCNAHQICLLFSMKYLFWSNLWYHVKNSYICFEG